MSHLSTIAAALALALSTNIAVAQSDSSTQSAPSQDQAGQASNNATDLTSMKNNGRPTTDSAPEKTRQIQSMGTDTGNAQMPTHQPRPSDLTSRTNPGQPSTDSAPEMTRKIMQQDANTGNDQMGHGKDSVRSFTHLDATHSGYVTKEEAKNDKWLMRHFNQCDTDHNGKVSQPEYKACTTGSR